MCVCVAGRVVGVSAAATSYASSCGRIALTYRREGGMQCAKVPEGASAARPTARVVPPVRLDCGAEGGRIVSVDFASWGTPSGTCGAFEEDARCHVPSVAGLVARRCVGRQACSLPSTRTVWGDLPAACGMARLFVQVRCEAVESLHAAVDVPVGAMAVVELTLPSTPMRTNDTFTVSEGVTGADKTLALDGGESSVLGVVKAALQGTVDRRGSVAHVTLASGSFHLHFRTLASETEARSLPNPLL